jgi:hypothetical protein
MPEYIHWDAPGVESEQPGEPEKIKQVSEQFCRFQMMNFDEHHHALRGTHLKTQGVRILSIRAPSLMDNSALLASSSSTTTYLLILRKACLQNPVHTM